MRTAVAELSNISEELESNRPSVKEGALSQAVWKVDDKQEKYGTTLSYLDPGTNFAQEVKALGRQVARRTTKEQYDEICKEYSFLTD